MCPTQAHYNAGLVLLHDHKEKSDARYTADFNKPYHEVPPIFDEFDCPVEDAPLSIFDINGTWEQHEDKLIRNEIYNEPSKLWPISRPPKGVFFSVRARLCRR